MNKGLIEQIYELEDILYNQDIECQIEQLNIKEDFRNEYNYTLKYPKMLIEDGHIMFYGEHEFEINPKNVSNCFLISSLLNIEMNKTSKYLYVKLFLKDGEITLTSCINDSSR